MSFHESRMVVRSPFVELNPTQRNKKSHKNRSLTHTEPGLRLRSRNKRYSTGTDVRSTENKVSKRAREQVLLANLRSIENKVPKRTNRGRIRTSRPNANNLSTTNDDSSDIVIGHKVVRPLLDVELCYPNKEDISDDKLISDFDPDKMMEELLSFL